MELINRKNLLANIAKLESERDVLKNKKYEYKVKRAWPGVCNIEAITDVEYLIKAFNIIKEGTKGDDSAVDTLGLSKLGLVKTSNEPRLYYGYTAEAWEADLKLCAEELADVKKLESIEKAIKILRKNMSEEDKFKEDMTAVANLLGE